MLKVHFCRVERPKSLSSARRSLDTSTFNYQIDSSTVGTANGHTYTFQVPMEYWPQRMAMEVVEPACNVHEQRPRIILHVLNIRVRVSQSHPIRYYRNRGSKFCRNPNHADHVIMTQLRPKVDLSKDTLERIYITRGCAMKNFDCHFRTASSQGTFVDNGGTASQGCAALDETDFTIQIDAVPGCPSSELL